MFMAFLGLWLSNALRVIISITITEMVIPPEEDDRPYNISTCARIDKELTKNYTLSSGPKYDWDEYTQVLSF